MENNESLEVTEPAVSAPNPDFPAVESEVEEVPEQLRNKVAELGILFECDLQEGFNKEKWFAALLSGLALNSLMTNPAEGHGCQYIDLEGKPAFECSVDIDKLKDSPIMSEQPELVEFISDHAANVGEKVKDLVVLKDGDDWKCRFSAGGPEIEFSIDPSLYAPLDDLYNNNLFKEEEVPDDLYFDMEEETDNYEELVTEFTKCVTECVEEKEVSFERLSKLFQKAVLN